MTDTWTTLYGEHLSEITKRYRALMASLGVRRVVFSAGYQKAKFVEGDEYWPWMESRYFNHFVYWTGGTALLQLSDHGSLELFDQQEDNYWESPAVQDTACFAGHIMHHPVKSFTDLKLATAESIFVGEAVELAAELGFHPEQINPPQILSALATLRTQKTTYEIFCLQEATARAARGHEALRSLFLSGKTASEFDLYMEYLRTTDQTGFEEPYGTIVACGSNAATLHHVHYSRAHTTSDTSLLVDGGASFRGYGSDITRTYARGKSKPAQLFAELIARVDRLQQDMVAQVAVGLPYETLHDRCHLAVAVVLADLKICHGSMQDLVSSGVTRVFLPHGLGHSLGLQVHDVGMKLKPSRAENPYLRNTSVLAPGHVVTIEPGIYFIKSLLKDLRSKPHASLVNWDLVQELQPFGGVRIEDDILVTPEGPRNLTRPFIS